MLKTSRGRIPVPIPRRCTSNHAASHSSSIFIHENIPLYEDKLSYDATEGTQSKPVISNHMIHSITATADTLSDIHLESIKDLYVSFQQKCLSCLVVTHRMIKHVGNTFTFVAPCPLFLSRNSPLRMGGQRVAGTRVPLTGPPSLHDPAGAWGSDSSKESMKVKTVSDKLCLSV